MSRRGSGDPASWSRRIGPPVLLSAGCELSPLSCLSAVCRSAATASLRCGLVFHRAHRLKAAQEVGQGGEGALVGAKRRALTGVLHLGSRTEAAS